MGYGTVTAAPFDILAILETLRVSAMTHRLAALYVVIGWPCFLILLLCWPMMCVVYLPMQGHWSGLYFRFVFLRMMHTVYVQVAVARAVATVLFALFCVCFGTQQR